jgi:hypothetical protein
MLRGVVALAAVGVVLGSSASAVELITYPTLARGTVTFAPVPFATLNIDWLGAFATDNDAKQFTVSQFIDFLSDTPARGDTIALIGPAELTRSVDPPQPDQRAFDRLAPFDLQ